MLKTKEGYYYVSRSHVRGSKKMINLTEHRTKVGAIKATASKYATGNFNYCDVIKCPSFMSYYGPQLVCRISDSHGSIE